MGKAERTRRRRISASVCAICGATTNGKRYCSLCARKGGTGAHVDKYAAKRSIVGKPTGAHRDGGAR